MQVTYAGLMRSVLERAGLRFASVVMEEAGQTKELEAFTALALGGGKEGSGAVMERAVLVGDDGQLPPVVASTALAAYARLDVSLFGRLIRLGVAPVTLDMQGRCRPSLALLFFWNYPGLGNLPHTLGQGKSICQIAFLLF